MKFKLFVISGVVMGGYGDMGIEPPRAFFLMFNALIEPPLYI